MHNFLRLAVQTSAGPPPQKPAQFSLSVPLFSSAIHLLSCRRRHCRLLHGVRDSSQRDSGNWRRPGCESTAAMPNQSRNKKKNTKKAELPGDDEDDLAAHMELSRQAGSSATLTTHTRTCGDANGCDLKGKMPHACSEEEKTKGHATVIDSCWLESRNVTENTAESLKDSHSEQQNTRTQTHLHVFSAN